jgi:hypothetical protein
MIIGLFLENVFSHSLFARRIAGNNPLDYQGRMALYRSWGIRNPENYDFLKILPVDVVEHRLDKLKIILERKDAGYYTELLNYPSSDLENRAKALDEIKELKVSYKQREGIEKIEPLILTANPSTVRENLFLLEKYNIDQVRYSDLLFKISTFKLKTNINFLKAKEINFSTRPQILFQPTRYLKNNYYILKLLNSPDFPINLSNLGFTTQELVERIRNNPPSLFTPQLSEGMDILLKNIIEMLPAQKEFYNWWKDNPDEDIYGRIYQAGMIFESHGLQQLHPPAFSIFILTTAINPSSNLSKAVLKFIQYLIKGRRYDVGDLSQRLAEDYKLSDGEFYYLGMIMKRDTRR